MNIVGNKRLLMQLSEYSVDTLPRSIIIIGKEGSGKHTLSKYLADKFKIPLLDITENITEELVSNIYRDSLLKAYIIDLSFVVDKDQNRLLKLFEEPPSNAFIFLLATNTLNVIPTLLNRGFVLNIEPYKVIELQEFAESNKININQKYLGNIIETPGDILKVDSLNIKIDTIKELTDKILNKLTQASYPNTLTIIDKLNFKDEYDKIDVNFFLKMLYLESANSYLMGLNKSDIIFDIVSDTIRKLVDSRLNKKVLITHMLTLMWKGVRS